MLAGANFTQILTYIKEFLSIRSGWDILRAVIDVGIVAYVFYKLISALKDSRAYQVVKGIVLILVLSFIAQWLRLTTVSFILKAFVSVLPVLLIVLFQPELRRWLEGMGNNKITGIFSPGKNSAETDAMIGEVAKAAFAMGSERVGALIVFERKTSLGEIVRTGTEVNADVSAQLLRLIFVPNTPLHDGAVIIRENKIHAAACYLPLTSNTSLDKDLGTRHRAGIGITENTDCISIIVSEETGKVSVAMNGELARGVNPDKLKAILREELYGNTEKKSVRKEKKK